ncbi:MAG TPA: hypothetical protein VHU83_06380 [Bryobacteraceae bacterium]|jgi:integrase|nr:hypothetical protein [Bryobacteraceae bacterium]
MPRQRFQDPKIQQSKNGSYFIRPWLDVITAEGLERKKKTITLGPASIGKRAAKTAKDEAMKAINRADFVVQSQIPFGELLDNFLRAHVEKLGYGSRCKYTNLVKNHIRPAFERLSLYELTTKRIQDWIDEKGKTGLSWSTRADLRQLLSGIFSRAIEWGLYKEQNPVRYVKIGRKRLVREKRKLTDDQTRRFLAALPYDLRVMCCVGLFSTLRVSESLGLQEKHLDFERGLIMVRQRFCRGDLDLAKNEKAVRDVPMGYLLPDLKRMCTGDPDAFVFRIKTKPAWGTRAGQRSEPKAICRDDRDLNQHFLRPIAKALGFYWKGFGFHALRREAITAIGSVAGIGQAMSAAGHTHADMSLLYTLQDWSEQDRAIRAHQERILGKPDGGIQ